MIYIYCVYGSNCTTSRIAYKWLYNLQSRYNNCLNFSSEKTKIKQVICTIMEFINIDLNADFIPELLP